MGNLNIAVTGGDGFLGSYLVNALQKKGIFPHLFDINKNSLFDIETMKDFVKEKDIIFHLAGANRDTDSNLVKVNTLGTMGLLEAMVKHGKKGAKIIFASSFQVYKPTKEDSPVDENTTPSPTSVYGISKYSAEKLIVNYSETKDIKGIVFRFSNLYGAGGKPFYNSVIATFLELIKEGKVLTINGSGEQKRDFLFVADAVDALLKVIDYSPERLEIFNICSGKLTSLNEIIDFLKMPVKDKKIEVSYNKDGKEELFFLRGDNQKAQKILNWRPKADIKEEIKNIYESQNN